MTTQNQSTQQPEGGEKPFNYRQLEESRDKHKADAEKWRSVALGLSAKSVGVDPKQGIGKLLFDAFLNANPEPDPETFSASFLEFAKEHGVEPETGTKEGEEGEGGDGKEQEQTPAQQLLTQLQQQGTDLADLSKPPAGGKATVQEQIAAAEAAGDQAKVDQLNAAWAAQLLEQ